MRQSDSVRTAMRVSAVSIAVNVMLSLFKFAAGVLAHSGAMVSDAAHSASDVLSTVVVMVGVGLSGRKSDESHPYGHERLECAASTVLAVLLLATGLGVGAQGVSRLAEGGSGLREPGLPALAAAVISIGVKEWMYWYTRAAARRIHSGALMADAWHHRSDSLSSVGAFAGIAGARLGFPVLDSLAGVIISLFIVKASVDIFRDSMEKLVDKSCDRELVMKMRRLAEDCAGVERVDDIRTRVFGTRVYVDIEIAVDENMPLREAHSIADQVSGSIGEGFGAVKHCMVHVNPAVCGSVTRDLPDQRAL